MKFRIDYLLAFIIIVIFGCKTTSTIDLLKEAKIAARTQNLDNALSIYDRILSKDKNSIPAYLGKAGIFYSKKKWNQSKSLLLETVKLNPNYDSEVYYSLGLIEENLEQYQNASNHFKSYLKRIHTAHKKWKKANLKVEQNNFRASAIANPVPFNPIPLNEINSKNSEYWAVSNADNSSFIFTRRINNQEDLFITNLNEKNDITPLPFNTIQNEAAHCVSADGKLIILTRCDAKDSKGGCDLYYSQLINNNWSDPKNMGNNINSSAWDAQPSLSSDGKTLYFASKRKGSTGKSDIFISHLENGNRWTIPEPLNDNINTIQSDESPFIHPDGQTLFFRSNGHIGMGDFDVFYCKKDPISQKWSKTTNIGFPINTKANDGALTVSYDGKTAYYSTDHFSIERGETPNLDIVQFELPKQAQSTPVSYVRIKVLDANTRNPISTVVEFYDLSSKEILFDKKTKLNGSLFLSLLVEKNYLLNINNKDYNFYSNHLQLKDVNSEYEAFNIEILLQPIEKAIEEVKNEIILHNIFFNSGSSNLLASSDIEIKNLADYLDQNKLINIKIIGHTDNIGTSENNQFLSENRAKSVYQALINNGVEATRLSFEGKGETQPLKSNDTKDGRSVNRRTSFILQP